MNTHNNLTVEIGGISDILALLRELHNKVEQLTQKVDKIQHSEEKQLNRKEVSTLLGITWQQVEAISYRMDKNESASQKENKHLSCKKIGKNWLYDAKEVQDFKVKFYQ